MAETQFMMIPPYSYPPSGFWDAVIGAAPTTAIVIANVASGPGTSAEANFATVYASAAGAGILVLGYVYTSYAARSAAAVEADVASWYSFYGASLSGILFDEVQATTGNETYYTNLVSYVHTNHAGSTVVLNPGDIPAQAYVSTPIGDIICVCEDSYANFAADAAAAPSWLFLYSSSRIAVTCNTCPTEADMVTAVGLSASAFNAKYVWVTSDGIYNVEPSYFDAEVTLLEGSSPPGPSPALNQWSASASANADVPVPALLPLSLALDPATETGGGTGTPTAGNWMFAVAAWRQSAGSAATIAYNSSVSIRDDAHNFWIPVSSVQPDTGIVRSSIWMAPAFRVPQYVFASPTAFQSALTLTVLEFEAQVPWYEVASITSTYANQGTAITQSQDPATGLFTLGAIAYDLNTITPTYSDTGFTELTGVVASNGSDHTGDLTMQPFAGTTTGSSMTLGATGGTADWAEVLVTVHGVSDAIAFPYNDAFPLENWPALIFEMACGAALNENWSFNSGISPWAEMDSAALSASSLFTFGNSAGSLLVTPPGSAANPGAISEVIAVPAQQPSTMGAYTAVYTADYEPAIGTSGEAPGPAAFDALAYINIPAGWAAGVTLGVVWLDSSGHSINDSTQNFTVTGSQQELSATFTAPANAAGAQLFVQFAGLSDPPATTLMYIGYAALSIPGVFGAIPEDEITWIDMSLRTFTQSGIRYSRGIQYEQQSLEAGELEIPLWNNDGYLTAGNNQSPYFPFIGQPDVPVRLRAIWPRSVTPYSVLYYGYSDDVKYQRDETTLISYITLEAADVWSRLTAQMLTAVQQEFLADLTVNGAGGYWPCNDMAGAVTAANLAPTTAGPLIQQTSKYGATGINFGFGNTLITLAGDPGGTGWVLDSLTSAEPTKGASLLLYPQNNSSLPALSAGVSVEFWVFISDAHTSGITWNGVLAACVGVKGLVWELTVGAPSGADTGQILFTVYDRLTQAPTTTTIDPGDNWGLTKFFTVEFTQFTWQVYENGDLAASGGSDFPDVYNGFSFNGLNIPWQGLSGTCFNGVLQDIAIYPLELPQARILTQYNVGLTAEQDELDTSRVARVVGYGGFAPPLAMLGPIGVWPDADVDPVTQITDTIGQVVSSYLTNIASSTLAALFTDGTGALVYRRRLEWYDRPIGQWTLGEHAPAALNVNPYFSIGVASWTAVNATLIWFVNGGQFNGSGAATVTANGSGVVTLTPENQPATPGQEYSCTIAVQAPAGYATGAQAEITWLNSSAVAISTVTGNTVPLVAGAWTVLTVTGQAPAATAFLQGIFSTSGTPSSSTEFVISSVVTAVYPGEAPYLRDEKLSDDRAQMFNSAVITQSGTGEKTTFSGTSFNFTPTSGITVTAVNETSASQRGNVPYTATAYLQNTQQNSPQVASFTDEALAIDPLGFVPAEGCIEDLAQWIINTLGTPVLRAESATLTPGSTWQAMITALQAEIGDTVTLNLRTLGAPALSVLTYLSAIEAEIDVKTGWNVTYQLSPAPVASILICDDPSNGVADGTSIIGW